MMKCIYCGEELKEGSLYCPKCGKAVQIVPDYNIYDDDYLNQVLTEESQKISGSGPDRNKKPAPAETKHPGKKHLDPRQKKIIFLVLGIVCVLIFALLILGAAIRSNHANSFDYQVGLAEKAQKAGDTKNAIACYENALALDKNSIEVRLALAELYTEENDYDSALVLYQEVIRADRKNRQACKGLIAIYEKQNNTDAILSLSEAVDDSLKDLFADYQVEGPQFSLKSGSFENAQILQMLSTKGYEIYYTVDGSDPKERGLRYTEPVKLDENNKTYTVKAVCKNEKGIYSEVTEASYKILIPAPDEPIVSPDGGDFGMETSVTITVPDGCSAYYTWDGSTPTAASHLYTQPIKVPEGNNILSVVIIDHTTKLSSDVYRGNFIYYSQDYTAEDAIDDPADNAEE